MRSHGSIVACILGARYWTQIERFVTLELIGWYLKRSGDDASQGEHDSLKLSRYFAGTAAPPPYFGPQAAPRPQGSCHHFRDGA